MEMRIYTSDLKKKSLYDYYDVCCISIILFLYIYYIILYTVYTYVYK